MKPDPRASLSLAGSPAVEDNAGGDGSAMNLQVFSTNRVDASGLKGGSVGVTVWEHDTATTSDGAPVTGAFTGVLPDPSLLRAFSSDRPQWRVAIGPGGEARIAAWPEAHPGTGGALGLAIAGGAALLALGAWLWGRGRGGGRPKRAAWRRRGPAFPGRPLRTSPL